MRSFRFRVPTELMDLFSQAHQIFLRKYYPHSGGPDLAEFVFLCAQKSCLDVLEEAESDQC